MKNRCRLAVDIGGTFTDIVLKDHDGRVLSTGKTPTTHENPTEGAWLGVQRALRDAAVPIESIGLFIHGTTLATNALIERRGANVATITTEGFRDILEIAYERRYDQYDVLIDKPDLIVPRSRSFTIPERVSAKGEVIKPIDLAAVPAIIKQLEQQRTDAVAICLLHSYANPGHEKLLKDTLLEVRPELSISLSSEVSPEAREFDRLCTTVANAYIQPLIAGYLTNMAAHFRQQRLNCPILMVTASGGMTTLDTAARLPIRLVESGPAGGAVLAARIAQQAGEESVLSFDMGGTTAKLCLIDDYVPQTSRQFEIARAARFFKGSGMPVRIPVIEMIEIGAGGGSIASVDQLGRLSVGPQSAGSEPGPAAYGKGGTFATVTDADFALGLVDGETFAEGRMKLNAPLNQRALEKNVAEPLGLSAAGAALAISEIVNENMANAARMHAVESGKDLGSRTMIAFGGNGPLHATRVARRAGINKILIPPDPGVGSAVGFLHAPVSFEIVRSYYSLLSELPMDRINHFLTELVQEAADIVSLASDTQTLTERRVAFMRYKGQGHEIEIELPGGLLQADDIGELQSRFELGYRKQFSRPVPGMQIEILNWGVSVSTKRESLAKNPAAGVNESQVKKSLLASAKRQITCDVKGCEVTVPVLQRRELAAGTEIQGPALILEPQTTTLVSADFTAHVDHHGNIHLQRKGGAL